MHVHVPQTRYEELANTVDDLCVLWDMCLLRWNNRDDAIPIDDDGHVGLGSMRNSVDHGDMFDGERLWPGTTAEKCGKDAHGKAEVRWASMRQAQRFFCKMWNETSNHFILTLTGQYRHCPRLCTDLTGSIGLESQRRRY